MGPTSSGKTNTASVFALADYYAFPKETTILCSSTSRDMLQLRVWGEIKKYHRHAQERHPVPGHISDSKMMLTTDGREVEGREFRNGIVGVACRVGGNYVGLTNYVGIKNKRVRLIADELQFMPRSFCDALNNLGGNPDFKCIGLGNPKDPTDAHGTLCEPHSDEGGWEGMGESNKTRCWKSRWPGGRTVQLNGEDSPNLDFAEGLEPFPFLIGRKKLREAADYYGKDSLQYKMMNAGIMPSGAMSRRVITRQMCERHRAKEVAIWTNASLVTKLVSLDAAYGSVGGDRTVIGELWFGQEIGGAVVLSLIGNPEVIPHKPLDPTPVEEQIALGIKAFCEARDVPPWYFFFDGTGRSSLTSALARLWSPRVVPVEFGGRATTRPIANVPDASKRHRKFVSELWFASRYGIEADQIRGLTDAVIEEGTMREWTVDKGPQGEIYEDVESKEITRGRMGRSPDLYDMFVTGIEGARRLGFRIVGKFANVPAGGSKSKVKDFAAKYREMNKKRNLVYAS